MAHQRVQANQQNAGFDQILGHAQRLGKDLKAFGADFAVIVYAAFAAIVQQGHKPKQRLFVFAKRIKQRLKRRFGQGVDIVQRKQGVFIDRTFMVAVKLCEVNNRF